MSHLLTQPEEIELVLMQQGQDEPEDEVCEAQPDSYSSEI